ncbi:MAG: hypothetical protein V4506_04575 [Bacteroidota bacterium]
MPLDLTINQKNAKTVGASFDRIAEELINHSQLNLQGILYTFTEIEFYYFDKATHPDKYTHKHSYNSGKWRFHLQGLDISLGYITEEDNFVSYGGILIRGLKSGKYYINGPKRILALLFEKFGDVEIPHKEFGIVPSKNNKVTIYKSFRKGLSERYPEFNQLAYRYYHSIELWNELHVSLSEKKGIVKSSVRL